MKAIAAAFHSEVHTLQQVMHTKSDVNLVAP